MTAAINALVKDIVEYCIRNGEYESVFLTPSPAFSVNVTALFDYLSERTGIEKQQIGDWVEAEAKRKRP